MTVKHWILSVNREEDREKIEMLSRRGKLLRVVKVFGSPVFWEYELEGAHDRDGNPVLITASVGTGR